MRVSAQLPLKQICCNQSLPLPKEACLGSNTSPMHCKAAEEQRTKRQDGHEEGYVVFLVAKKLTAAAASILSRVSHFSQRL
jgi:hypothetical protein